MIIAVDFDGTCVTHEYPKVGKEIGASHVLKILVEEGHRIVLNTMRGKDEGTVLKDAVKWFDKHGIPLYGVNESPSQKAWSSSPKVYAHLYIDDAALGCPLVDRGVKSPFVDWLEVYRMLLNRNVIMKHDISKDVMDSIEEEVEAVMPL